MKLIFQLLFVAVFVAVVTVEADKSNTENESVDVLDQAFYGIESTENDETDSGEEDDTEEDTTTLPPGRSRGGRPSYRHRGRGRHNHRAAKGGWRKTMTPEEKFESICRAIKTKSNSFWQSKKMSMKMRRVEPEVREKFQTVMTARNTAMSECCLLNGTEAIQCADNIRGQHYTRVCNGEEPLCIWSLLKGRKNTNNQSETVTKCCEFQGEERNSCFQSATQKQFGRFSERSRKNRHH